MIKAICIKLFSVLMICALFCAGQALAQTQANTGQITGVVSDSTGAIVPNAAVTATNNATNQTISIVSGSDGTFRFVTLQPGVYTVKASAANFGEQTLTVEVQIGRATDALFTLGAGDVSAEVLVSAEGVQTTQSNPDSVIDETAISNLPINGRRFQDFVTLTPGAHVEESRGQISLSGQRGINGNVNVDGVDFNQPFFGGIRGGERSNQAFVMPQESIKEFQVVAAGYSAEFGRSTGGIINTVTKSGSNDFRGSLFYLYRPEQLSRTNKFSEAVQEQDLDRYGVDVVVAPTQHQFGGSIGGPIIKDKLFFFGSYEQQRFRVERFVIFSDFLNLTPTARQQEGFDFMRSLEAPYQQTNDAYAALGKIDWNINNNHRANVRYNFARNDALNAVARGETDINPTTTSAISSNGTERNRNNIVVGQVISNLSSNAINELRLQWAKEERPREANEEAPNVFFGNNFGQYGSRNFLPTTQYDTRWQLADSLTYIAGSHTMKFGGEYSRIFATQRFGFNQFGAYSLTAGGASGILNNISSMPDGSYLGRFDNSAARYNRQIGNREAEFVNHEVAFFAQDSWRITPRFTLNYGLRVEQQFNPTPDVSNSALVDVVKNTIFPIRGKGFDPSQIPDSGWQVGPRLGFAWDPAGDGKTVIRGFTGLYYARTPGLLLADSMNNYRSTPGNVSTQLPLVGFSQTSFLNFLQTPAGANYIAITGCNPAAPTNPCTPNTIFRQFAIAGINLNSFGLGELPDVTPDQIATIAGALGLSPNPFVGAQVTGHAEDFKNPRSFQAGFGVERQLARGFYLNLDYSMVKTDRLQRNRDLNVPAPLTAQQYVDFLQANNTPAQFNTWVTNGAINSILASGRTFIAQVTPGGLGLSGGVTTQQRPTNNPLLNPNYRFALGAVQVRESTAKALYNAATLRLRVVRSWVRVNASYTLASNFTDDDNERDSGGVAYSNPYDLSGEWGPSRIDRTHQFVANPVFFLPFGFEVSAAVRLRSGTPLNTYIGTDANGDNVFNDRPLFAPGSEFSRNRFRNKPVYDTDLRVQKGFKFDESKRLIFHADIFNVFNLPNIQFPFPGTNSTSGSTLQYCTSATTLCGLNGVTNPNFMNIRNSNGTLNTSLRTGSQAFQVQLGARFQF